jgi:hypothetical protein
MFSRVHISFAMVPKCGNQQSIWRRPACWVFLVDFAIQNDIKPILKVDVAFIMPLVAFFGSSFA